MSACMRGADEDALAAPGLRVFQMLSVSAAASGT